MGSRRSVGRIPVSVAWTEVAFLSRVKSMWRNGTLLHDLDRFYLFARLRKVAALANHGYSPLLA
jgi:hypothetical protein